MTKLTHAKRSKISKKAWRGRKPQHKCNFCSKGIFVHGINIGNRWYHRSCWQRMQVAKLRRETATKGFYAK